MSSEPKFTPGPWFPHPPSNANRRDWGVTALAPYDPSVGAKRRIAWVGNASAQVSAITAEIEANANLIAAAPDLYAALSDALKAGIIDIDDEPEKARAVLAKARGETP